MRDVPEAASRKIKVAYLVSHPIQYQAPLLRRLAQEPDLSVTALFRSDLSVRGYTDRGFGVRVEWDVPLLEGYPHQFLPAIGPTDKISRWRPVNYGLGRILRQGGYDALWTHGFGAPYQRWAILLAKLMGLKVLVRDETHRRSRRRSGREQLKARLGFSFLKATVSEFLAIGSANRDYYIEQGVRPERIHLVPYAVDNAFFGAADADAKARHKAEVLPALGAEADRPVILFAAKLQIRKRCPDLIRAFMADGVWSHPSRPLLLIVGDGEEMAVCRELVAACPQPEAIRFLGFKNQTELRALYRAADLFVLPSDSEPWGLAINEAMSAGCGILAAEEVGAVPDLVQDGVNGFTFDAGDVAGLAQAIRKSLAGPAQLRAMAEASLEKIAHWSFEEDVAGLREALGLPARAAQASPSSLSK